MNKSVIAGNIFNKYTSSNPLIQYTIASFMRKANILLHSVHFDNLLDVGCGEGFLVRAILNEFPQKSIFATDISFDILSSYKHIAAEISRHCCSIYELPYKNNSWDVVIACEVLEHLEYPEKALEEMKRIGRSHFLFTVPLEPWWRLANIMRGKYVLHYGNTPGHVHHWNKRTLLRLLEKHFTVKKYSQAGLWQLALTQKE